jgi:16S rRNA processing protein RimM
MTTKETIVVGKVSSAHGILGEIMVFPLTDDVERFFDLDYFLCEGVRYSIDSLRIHKGQALIGSDAIKDRTQAEKMKGKLIEIERADAVPLSEGEFFIEELKGLSVQDLDGTVKGTLVDVLQTGAADLFEVDFDGKRMLMPFLRAYVAEINVAGGFIRLDATKCID